MFTDHPSSPQSPFSLCHQFQGTDCLPFLGLHGGEGASGFLGVEGGLAG